MEARKNILILGATGHTGAWTVKHALDLNDDVHVFVRNPGKLSDAVKSRAHVIIGDLFDAAAVATAVEDTSPDAILICSGHPPRDAIAPLNAIAVPAILKALTKGNRVGDCLVIYLSGLFAAPEDDPLPWYSKLLRAIMVPAFGYQASLSDNLAVTEYLMRGEGAAGGLQYTIIRMALPVEGPSRGTIIPVMANPRGAVTFTDMGLFMVRLAHGAHRDEVLRKAIKPFYAK